ncbi:hypothetical protein U1Q18_014878 [Sarracenia purpurea var. burkii]
MRSKRVPWSTLTNSASKVLSSSSAVLSSDLGVSTCFLQYLMTLAKILLMTFGNGMLVSAQVSSIRCLMVCDSNAIASSTSNVSPFELFNTMIFDVDMNSGRYQGNLREGSGEREKEREQYIAEAERLLSLESKLEEEEEEDEDEEALEEEERNRTNWIESERQRVGTGG